VNENFSRFFHIWNVDPGGVGFNSISPPLGRESTVCARNLRYSIIFQCLILLLSAACRRHRRMAACMCLPYLAVDK